MCDSSANRRWACSNLAVLSFRESGTKRCVAGPHVAHTWPLGWAVGSIAGYARNMVQLTGYSNSLQKLAPPPLSCYCFTSPATRPNVRVNTYQGPLFLTFESHLTVSTAPQMIARSAHVSGLLLTAELRICWLAVEGSLTKSLFHAFKRMKNEISLLLQILFDHEKPQKWSLWHRYSEKKRRRLRVL